MTDRIVTLWADEAEAPTLHFALDRYAKALDEEIERATVTPDAIRLLRIERTTVRALLARLEGDMALHMDRPTAAGPRAANETMEG